MDAASVSRGTQVLCLNPTGSMSQSLTTPMGAIGLASRSLARLEALVLERRGARVESCSRTRARSRDRPEPDGPPPAQVRDRGRPRPGPPARAPQQLTRSRLEDHQRDLRSVRSW